MVCRPHVYSLRAMAGSAYSGAGYSEMKQIYQQNVIAKYTPTSYMAKTAELYTPNIGEVRPQTEYQAQLMESNVVPMYVMADNNYTKPEVRAGTDELSAKREVLTQLIHNELKRREVRMLEAA